VRPADHPGEKAQTTHVCARHGGPIARQSAASNGGRVWFARFDAVGGIAADRLAAARRRPGSADQFRPHLVAARTRSPVAV
jgi:hypothetical protein